MLIFLTVNEFSFDTYKAEKSNIENFILMLITNQNHVNYQPESS